MSISYSFLYVQAVQVVQNVQAIQPVQPVQHVQALQVVQPVQAVQPGQLPHFLGSYANNFTDSCYKNSMMQVLSKEEYICRLLFQPGRLEGGIVISSREVRGGIVISSREVKGWYCYFIQAG